MASVDPLVCGMLACAVFIAVLAARWCDAGWLIDLERFSLWRAERHETWSRRWLAVRRWALRRH